MNFQAEPLKSNDGYTFTLTTKFGYLLNKAQALYGPRDLDWTPLGIEFCSAGPKIWYPGNIQNLAIQLSNCAAHEPHRAIYQLAHEVIHVLAPFKGRVAPVIEEGLATVFSEDILVEEFGILYFTNEVSYIDAGARVRDLLSESPNAIKHLRAVQPTFKKMNSETFKDAGLDVSEQLIKTLVADFVRGET